MKRIIACAFALLLSGAVVAQPIDDFDSLSTPELIDVAPEAHPAALYVLSSRLMAQGRGLDAAKWMYAGQLRYRFLVTALGDAGQDENILLSALAESVGRPVNEYIAADPDEWIEAMKWALDWDAAHGNALTSKTTHASDLAAIRSGLRDLIVQVDGNRDLIRKRRREAGLPVR